MRDFFLSKNTKFPFSLWGWQHILMLFVTFVLLLLIFIFKKKIVRLDDKAFKKIRLSIIFIILFNMFLYRFSYIWYGVYDIKRHLSLYYCHITNYIFVLALIVNYKPFYKIVYGLSWMGSFWSIFFPDISGGIDVFIFYSFFISHNLILVFTTFIMSAQKIKYRFKDIFYSFVVALSIFAVTNIINYDFNTRYNIPTTLLGKYSRIGVLKGNLTLILAGLVGNIIALCINKIYVNKKSC